MEDRGIAVAGRADELLAAADAAVAGLRDLALYRLSETDVLNLSRRVEAAGRAIAGVGVRLAGELAERGTAQTLSARSPAHLLQQTLQLTMGEARTRVAIAQAGLPHDTPSGAEVEPELPELVGALDAGDFDAERAGIIARTMTRLPASVDAGTRAACSETLLTQARDCDAVRLRQIAAQILLIVDPDGTTPDDAPDRAELTIGTRRADGLTPLRALLDDLTIERLRQALEPLAAPKPLDQHTPDPRPAAQRRAWALGELLRRYLATGHSPHDGGVRPQVVITINLEDLVKQAGAAWADYTGVVSPAVAVDRHSGCRCGGGVPSSELPMTFWRWVWS